MKNDLIQTALTLLLTLLLSLSLPAQDCQSCFDFNNLDEGATFEQGILPLPISDCAVLQVGQAPAPNTPIQVSSNADFEKALKLSAPATLDLFPKGGNFDAWFSEVSFRVSSISNLMLKVNVDTPLIYPANTPFPLSPLPNVTIDFQPSVPGSAAGKVILSGKLEYIQLMGGDQVWVDDFCTSVVSPGACIEVDTQSVGVTQVLEANELFYQDNQLRISSKELELSNGTSAFSLIQIPFNSGSPVTITQAAMEIDFSAGLGSVQQFSCTFNLLSDEFNLGVNGNLHKLDVLSEDLPFEVAQNVWLDVAFDPGSNMKAGTLTLSGTVKSVLLGGGQISNFSNLCYDTYPKATSLCVGFDKSAAEKIWIADIPAFKDSTVYQEQGIGITFTNIFNTAATEVALTEVIGAPFSKANGQYLSLSNGALLNLDPFPLPIEKVSVDFKVIEGGQIDLSYLLNDINLQELAQTGPYYAENAKITATFDNNTNEGTLEISGYHIPEIRVPWLVGGNHILFDNLCFDFTPADLSSPSCLDFESIPEGTKISDLGDLFGDTLFVEDEVVVTLTSIPGGMYGNPNNGTGLFDDLTGFPDIHPSYTGNALVFGNELSVNFNFQPLGDPVTQTSFNFYGDHIKIRVNGAAPKEFDLNQDINEEVASGVMMYWHAGDLGMPLPFIILAGNQIHHVTIEATESSLDNFCFSTDPLLCQVYNTSVDNLECKPGNLYDFDLKFDYAIQGQVNGFHVYVDGKYEYYSAPVDLPIKIKDHPGSGPTTEIIVCGSYDPACCDTIIVDLPICDCFIGDILAEPQPCTPNEVFFVDIDFDYQSTSDSFELKGNGNFYGTFAYADLPIQVGPFDGGSQLEFVALDQQNPNCSNATDLDIVFCNCALYDAEVLDIQCLSDSMVKFTFDLDTALVTSDSFHLYLEDTLFQTFAYGDLPITVEAAVNSTPGGDTLAWFACASDNPDCCTSLKYVPAYCGDCYVQFKKWPDPQCLGGNAHVIPFDLKYQGYFDSIEVYVNQILVTTLPADGYSGSLQYVWDGIIDGVFTFEFVPLGNSSCLSAEFATVSLCPTFEAFVTEQVCQPDGSHTLFFELELLGPNLPNEVQVSVDGINYGWIALNGTTFALENIPDLQAGDQVFFQICDNNGYCFSSSFEVWENCDTDCQLFATVLSICKGNEIKVEYVVEYVGADDKMEIYLDGQLLEVLTLNDPNGTLTGSLSIPVPGGELKFLIETPNGSVCLQEIPVFLPCNNTCELEVDVNWVCNGPEILIDYLAEYSGAVGDLKIFLNGQVWETLPLNGPSGSQFGQIWIPAPGGIVKFQIEGPNGSICIEEFDVFEPCNLIFPNVLEVECNNDGTLNILIDAEFQDPPIGNDLLIFLNNGDVYTVNINDLPVWLEDISGYSAGDAITFEFCLSQNSLCASYTVTAPNCLGGDCSLSDLEAAVFCEAGKTWVEFSFEAQNTSDQFVVIACGVIDTLSYNPNNQYLIEVDPSQINCAGGGSAFGVYDLEETANCWVATWVQDPDCADQCQIFDLQAEATDCEDGEYYLEFTFEAQNTGDQFVVLVDGQFVGIYPYGQLPILLGPFEGDGQTTHEIEVFDASDPDCSAILETDPVDCSQCAIEELEAIAFCEDDTYYVEFSFLADNTSDSFVVQTCNQVITLAYNPNNVYLLEVTEDQVLCAGGVVFPFSVYDQNNGGDCFAFTLLTVPNCPPVCKFEDLFAEAYGCDDGEFWIDFEFSPQLTDTSGFLAFVNGVLYGPFDYGQPFYTIGPFDGDGTTTYEILLVDINDPFCFGYFNLGQVDCPDLLVFDECLELEDFEGNLYEDLAAGDLLFKQNGVGVYSSPDLTGGSISIEEIPLSSPTLALVPFNAGLYFDFTELPKKVETAQFKGFGASWNIQINNLPKLSILTLPNPDTTYILGGGIELHYEFAPNNPLLGTFTLSGDIQNVTISAAGDFAVYGLCWTMEDAVWPGDANSDGIANYLDVLYLGVGFGTDGPGRANVSTDWEPVPAEDWPQQFADTTNYKHADCNGDGLIEAEDLWVVEDNYGLIHQNPGPMPQTLGDAGDPPLFIEWPDWNTVTPGQPFTANVVLGSQDIPVEDLYGIGFQIDLDTSLFTDVSFQLTPNWLTDLNSDGIGLVQGGWSQGLFEASMSRTDQSNVSGYGTIGQIIGIVDDLAGMQAPPAEPTLPFAQQADESAVWIHLPQVATLTTKPKSGNSVLLAPNPAPGYFQVWQEGNVAMKQIIIHDLVGKPMLRIPNPANPQAVEAHDWPEGMYFIQVELKNGEQVTQRVNIVRP